VVFLLSFLVDLKPSTTGVTMKTKFVLPKHANLSGHPCGNTVRIIWRTVGKKKVARCSICEKQLRPLTFKEVLEIAVVAGCGNGTICGSCWKCS